VKTHRPAKVIPTRVSKTKTNTRTKSSATPARITPRPARPQPQNQNGIPPDGLDENADLIAPTATNGGGIEMPDMSWALQDRT
jgi:hypothetical protein